jgi:hypothetical protein
VIWGRVEVLSSDSDACRAALARYSAILVGVSHAPKRKRYLVHDKDRWIVTKQNQDGSVAVIRSFDHPISAVFYIRKSS